MSVMCFDAHDLGNLASYLTDPVYDDLDLIAGWLAIVSKANVRAYVHSYAERHPEARKAAPATKEAIKHFALARSYPDKEDALSVAQLLDYNCAANDGSRDCNEEYYQAVNAVTVTALRKMSR